MNGLGTSQMKNLNKQTSGYCLGIIVWVSASVVVQPVMMVWSCSLWWAAVGFGLLCINYLLFVNNPMMSPCFGPSGCSSTGQPVKGVSHLKKGGIRFGMFSCGVYCAISQLHACVLKVFRNFMRAKLHALVRGNWTRKRDLRIFQHDHIWRLPICYCGGLCFARGRDQLGVQFWSGMFLHFWGSHIDKWLCIIHCISGTCTRTRKFKLWLLWAKGWNGYLKWSKQLLCIFGPELMN